MNKRVIQVWELGHNLIIAFICQEELMEKNLCCWIESTDSVADTQPLFTSAE